MKCILCGNRRLKTIKVIRKIPILECTKCSLGLLNQSVTKKLTTSHLYNFKDYKLEENKLIKRYQKLSLIIYSFKNIGKILEIGGGFGLFSKLISTRGNYQITFLEPYLKPHYIKNLKNVTVIREKLDGFFNKNKNKFDIIVLFDLIEHFSDPFKEIVRITRTLKKSSILVIQTPNYKSLMSLLCLKWSWWMIEDHKFFFSPKSFKLLCKLTKFKIEYFSTYEDLIDFKKNLDGNFTGIKNELIKKITKIGFFILFFPLYFLLRKFIWNLQRGGLIFAILRKQN